MIRTVVHLEPEDKAWLQRQAEKRQVSMAALIREAVRRYRYEIERNAESIELLLGRLRAYGRGETAW